MLMHCVLQLINGVIPTNVSESGVIIDQGASGNLVGDDFF